MEEEERVLFCVARWRGGEKEEKPGERRATKRQGDRLSRLQPPGGRRRRQLPFWRQNLPAASHPTLGLYSRGSFWFSCAPILQLLPVSRLRRARKKTPAENRAPPSSSQQQHTKTSMVYFFSLSRPAGLGRHGGGGSDDSTGWLLWSRYLATCFSPNSNKQAVVLILPVAFALLDQVCSNGDRGKSQTRRPKHRHIYSLGRCSSAHDDS